MAEFKTRRIEISMTEENHCYENAKAERVNGILKGEYGLDAEFQDKRSARKAASEAIWVYNNRRPHLSLGYGIPMAVHGSGRKNSSGVPGLAPEPPKRTQKQDQTAMERNK